MGKTRKRFVRTLTLGTTAVVLAGYTAFAGMRPLAPIQPQGVLAQPYNDVAAAQISWPAYGGHAVGAVGYGVLAHGGSEAPIATASIAKVMTALCVLQKKPLRTAEPGPTITLTQEDIDTYNSYVARDGSVVPVQLGEQLTEYQALQALLLPSANNIADTLARWAFGSISEYTTYANAYVTKLGLSSLHITDPSGLDAATAGSASDLTRLGEIAAKQPIVAEIVNQSTATIPVAGTISNVNRLLGKEGLVGIKTGNNDQDPGAFLFASNQTIGSTPVTIVGTVMGAPNLATALGDSLPLIAATKANLHEMTPVAANQEVASYSVPWQGTLTLRAQQDLTYAAWSNEKLQLTNTLQALDANSKNFGEVFLKNASGKVVAQTEVKLSAPLQQPSLLWRLLHPVD